MSLNMNNSSRIDMTGHVQEVPEQAPPPEQAPAETETSAGHSPIAKVFSPISEKNKAIPLLVFLSVVVMCVIIFGTANNTEGTSPGDNNKLRGFISGVGDQQPTLSPSLAPTIDPTYTSQAVDQTFRPTFTSHPTLGPSPGPTTQQPTQDPTQDPTTRPTPQPTIKPTSEPTKPTNPDPNGLLELYAYYYPWYYRDNWSRHGYQDTPLLGLYGTDEVETAEQHIEWALQTGISSWVVSWWGEDKLAMRHFKAGMMNAKNFDQINFFMLYESKILEGRGSWKDGSKENHFLNDLEVIRDAFFDHPSYKRINGRPVVELYITRSQFKWQDGFGPKVLDRIREKLGHNVYFIADEPFFNWFNDNPDDNQNAIVDGKQVFDAYTTYNMFVDSKVREGETATDYQLREGMPIWNEWATDVLLFPNVMPQYYDFRGHKPLLGNGDDFRRQLREVACLPKTNLNGAPNAMFITSFNEWWEGTQIEPENGSSENWNNYGFDYMDALAEFKKDVDENGFYWC